MIEVTAPKDRPVRLSSSVGVSINLKPGETRQVAPMFNVIAAEQGCSVRPVDETPAPKPKQTTNYDREGAIANAIEEIQTSGSTDEVTGQGNPRTASIRNRTGLDVTAAEIQAVMQRGNDS